MKKCVICGKEFKPKIKTQVTCGAECREENARRQARDYYERHSSQHMKEEKRICVECGGLLFRKQRARSRAAVSAAKRGREKIERVGKRAQERTEKTEDTSKDMSGVWEDFRDDKQSEGVLHN